MKSNSLWKSWNIIYPILIYYVVSNVVIYFAVLLLGITGTDYAVHYMLLQTMSAAICLPVLYSFYKKDKLFFTVFHQRTANELKETANRSRVTNGILMFAAGALAGLVLNNLIAATGLLELSKGYQSVTSQFFAGGVGLEILGAGILIPLVEELLYRGIVYARLTDWIGIPRAMALSAAIFALLHFNLVQFIYAFLMGFLLAWFLEKSHHLYGAVAGHIGANLLTVLRTETRFLDWMEIGTLAFWVGTLVMAIVCVLLLYYINGKKLPGISRS